MSVNPCRRKRLGHPKGPSMMRPDRYNCPPTLPSQTTRTDRMIDRPETPHACSGVRLKRRWIGPVLPCMLAFVYIIMPISDLVTVYSYSILYSCASCLVHDFYYC